MGSDAGVEGVAPPVMEHNHLHTREPFCVKKRVQCVEQGTSLVEFSLIDLGVYIIDAVNKVVHALEDEQFCALNIDIHEIVPCPIQLVLFKDI